MAKKFNEAVKSKLTTDEIEIFFKVLDTILEQSKNFDIKKGKIDEVIE